MIEFTEIEGLPDGAALRGIEEFYASIFDRADLEKFRRKLAAAESLLIELAFEADKIVGFKIGFQKEPKAFYSWVGGVDRNFRNRGVAGELMRRQHEWARERGFEIVRTKTKNEFKSMLILNIRNDFAIVDVYRDAQNEVKIILEKSLVR